MLQDSEKLQCLSDFRSFGTLQSGIAPYVSLDDFTSAPLNSVTLLANTTLCMFAQNEALQDKPVFSLAPNEKGMYSVEFSQTISILQAFFISVTVISCQKSPDLAEMGILSEDIVSQETKNANDETKKTPSVEAKTSLKYTPNPPLSPVGRV